MTDPLAGRTAPERDEAARRTRRVALGIAYDGSGFHGFAAQPRQRTVAGVLSEALGALSGTAPRLTCAGRTDTGVHASAQVAHADLDAAQLSRRLGLVALPDEGEVAGLAAAVSAQVGPEIVVWRAIVPPAGFDARRSALSRRYRYDIDTGLRADPLRRFGAWHVNWPLDLVQMRLAADALIGEHDFAAFCRRPPDIPSGPIVRRVLDTRLLEGDGQLSFEIESNAFCHQMVRSIVGALVAVGRGRIRPSELVRLLSSGNRQGAPDLASPAGLHLVAVRYPESLTGNWS